MTEPRKTPRPDYDRPNTVAGLIAKRGEIAGQIELGQIAVRRLINGELYT